MCKKLHPDLEVVYCDNLPSLARESDALVLVTEWEEFQKANWSSLARYMRYPLVIDGRNALSEMTIHEAGLFYRGVGH
jgi:UDPglucose 6-dehydrogenase